MFLGAPKRHNGAIRLFHGPGAEVRAGSGETTSSPRLEASSREAPVKRNCRRRSPIGRSGRIDF
jgi:hypothetical protein